MSAGIVVCSACRREVHQDGPLVDGRSGWSHCEDKSPICDDAGAVYPDAGEQPRGHWCGRDDI